MAELTFRSPGVSTREIDLSGPSPSGPQGTPAGVIGTANRGPAFVPVTFASYADFANTFGATDGEKFGPLAIQQWLQNRQAGTYLRVLGAGDGKTRLAAGTNAGKATRAGFAVGDKIVQANGSIGSNVNVGGDLSGRTYFLGAFMNEAANSTIFSDAFSDANALKGGVPAMPVIRATLFAPNGIQLAMSSAISMPIGNSNPASVATADFKSTRPAATSQGQTIGSINLQTQEFVLLLNGLKQTGDQGKNVITASFDPQSTNYVSKVFNTDPLKIEKQGHLLYNHYPIYNAYAVVTGAGIVTQSYTSGVSNSELAAWIVTGSQGQNAGAATLPNYEGFEDRFTTAFSPFVISQKFGGSPESLFKVHCLDDGEYPNTKFKLSIENIQKSNNPDVKYGKFDLVVRKFGDDDRNVQVLEAFRGLSINPGSDRYIARVIGDMRTYFDFDQRPGSQKLVVGGKFPNASRYIRVEMATPVDNGTIDKEALPVGFRGPHHLVTSGTTAAGLELLSYTGSFISGTDSGGAFHGGAVVPRANWANKVVEPPIPFRRTVAVGTGISKRVDGQLYWGAQFEPLDSLTEPNKNNSPVPSMSPIKAHVRPFASYHTTARNPWAGNNAGTADDGGVILDSDVFNNNRFTLENVQVATTTTDVVDSKEWQGSTYRRNASLVTNGVTKNDDTTTTGRFLNVAKDFGDLASKKFYKFSFFIQGGFNGVNIFNEDKAKLLDPAVKFEMGDVTNQGGTSGPTVAAYRKAIDILKEKSDAEIQLLAIPGLRQTQVTDYAIDAIEDRFDAVYIMDIKQFNSVNVEITGSSSGQPNVTYTVNDFKSRGIDSSFTAAYFPDVIVTDPTTNTNVQVPPSVAVLGAFGLNDSVAHPWFAPAGFARGSLAATDVQVKTNRANLDNLYDARINPITSFPGIGGPTIFGQKTLQAAESALDRVNVRRLLIEIRRKVRKVANNFIFEPNREATLARFSGAVNPILTRIQQQQGLDRFRVQIDTTTTTQADIENNTVRGKIFLQPTRSVEFISLDFVVSNAGAEI